MTPESPRTSALADRHRALGSGLEDWNDMGTAWEYSTNPNDEHDAIREAAGLFDMSPLKKIRITGPDASAVVDDQDSGSGLLARMATTHGSTVRPERENSVRIT